MSVTSTRRVSTSLSYSSSVRGGYEAAQGSQSFVENIDTSNNVSVQNENEAGGRKFYQRSSDENETEQFQAETSAPIDNGLKTTRSYAPLLDNDEDVAVVQNKSVGVYGENQEKSAQSPDRRDNPYVKHLYEHNEIVDEVDEFI